MGWGFVIVSGVMGRWTWWGKYEVTVVNRKWCGDVIYNDFVFVCFCRLLI
jgi:hypothetical protein